MSIDNAFRSKPNESFAKSADNPLTSALVFGQQLGLSLNAIKIQIKLVFTNSVKVIII